MNLMTVLEVEGFKQSIRKSKIFGDYLLFEYSDKNVLPNYLFTHIDDEFSQFVSMLKIYDREEVRQLSEMLKIYDREEVRQLSEMLKENRRNIFITTVQPSGTVGILMQTEEFGDTGQGVEPFFSLYYIRKYRIPNTDNEWNTLEYMNKLLEIKMDKLGIKDKQKILEELKNYGGKINQIDSIPKVIRD
jgi:ribonucleotide reductase alpha subunit